MFSHPKSCSKSSNLMITELFCSHILNMNRGSPQTRGFRRIHLSVFRKRLIKTCGLWGPERFLGLSARIPGSLWNEMWQAETDMREQMTSCWRSSSTTRLWWCLSPFGRERCLEEAASPWVHSPCQFIYLFIFLFFYFITLSNYELLT